MVRYKAIYENFLIYLKGAFARNCQKRFDDFFFTI